MCKIPNLPIKELDPRCREFVYLLNKHGFKTQFCCQGHEDDIYNYAYYIIFDKEVDDEKIDELIFILDGGRGFFYKWKRGDKKHILTNWMYKSAIGGNSDISFNQLLPQIDCCNLKNYFSKKKNDFWVYSDLDGKVSKLYKRKIKDSK